MGFGVLIAIRGATVAAEFIGRHAGLSGYKRQLLPVAACLMMVLASLMTLRYVYAPKQKFPAAIQYIQENRGANDLVVLVVIAEFPFNQYYKLNWATVQSADELNALRKSGRRT